MIQIALTEAEYRRLSGAISQKLGKLNRDCDAYNEYMSIQEKLDEAASAYVDEDPR